jgi:hypothetical protein
MRRGGVGPRVTERSEAGALAGDRRESVQEIPRRSLGPRPQAGRVGVAREFNVSLMTLWRWDHDPKLAELGWEPPVKIRTRNYRRRRPLEKFKVALRNFGWSARGPDCHLRKAPEVLDPDPTA